jgi:phenylacetate-CoA ligase
VNVFPTAVENLLRAFPDVEEFRVTLQKVRQMDELEIEVELRAGAESRAQEVAEAITQRFRMLLGFRPKVEVVAQGTLPRFELKARRFRKL